MPKTLSKALFNRLLRSRILRETLECLHQLSRMDCLFPDDFGNERVSVPRRSEQTFRRLMAQDPFMAETRINAACSALVETEDRISEIAGRCGFSTLSRFNQCFREITGMTPREWRKRARMRS